MCSGHTVSTATKGDNAEEVLKHSESGQQTVADAVHDDWMRVVRTSEYWDWLLLKTYPKGRKKDALIGVHDNRRHQSDGTRWYTYHLMVPHQLDQSSNGSNGCGRCPV